jgi:uncharacterized membrane protein YjgN (DUF898 family)
MGKFAGAGEVRWVLRGLVLAILAHAAFDAVLFTRTFLALLVIPLVIVLWRYVLAQSHRAQALDDRRWSGAPPG